MYAYICGKQNKKRNHFYSEKHIILIMIMIPLLLCWFQSKRYQKHLHWHNILFAKNEVTAKSGL